MRKHKKIEASGFLNDFVNKTLDLGNNLAKKLIRNGYNNQSTKTIKEYGDWKIFKINIYRKPIEGMLETALNLITVGKFDDGKAAGGYERFYHLGLFCVLGNNQGLFKNVICEKNEVIHIEQVSFNLDKYATQNDIMPVYLNKNLTLNNLLQNAQKQLGNNYFYYEPFSNNCQVYCKALLSGSGLLNPKLEAFVYQPLEEVIKKIPSISQKLAASITNLGGLTNRILGKGKKKGSGVVGVQVMNGDDAKYVDIPDLELDEDEEFNEDPLWYDLTQDNKGNPHLIKRKTKLLKDNPNAKRLKLQLLQESATEAQKRGINKIKEHRIMSKDIQRQIKTDRRDYLQNRNDITSKHFWNDFKDSLGSSLGTVGDIASFIPIPIISNLGEAISTGADLIKGGKRKKRTIKKVRFKK